MENNQKEVDTSLKLIAKTATILLVCLIFGKLLVYVYRVIIARYFGAETYGLYSLAIMVTAWFSLIASLGFSESLTRYLPLLIGKKKTESARYLFKFSIKILTFSSILLGILLFLLSELIAINIFHNENLIIYLKFFSLAIPLIVLGTPFNAALRSYGKTTWQALVGYVFHNVANVVLIIILLSLQLNTTAIILSYLFGFFVTFVCSYSISRYLLPELYQKNFLEKKQKKILNSEFIKYSLPLLLASFVGVFYSWVDSFSLGYLKTAVEVGLYNAAMPIALLLGIAPELFMQLFFPLINKEYAKNNFYAIKELSKQVNKWIFIINIPAMVLIFTFPEIVINLLFGPEYLGASTALRLLSLSSFLLSAFVPVSRKIIQMKGKSHIFLYDVIFAGVLNLTLNILFIPLPKIWIMENASGINGAALATLISSAVMSVVYTVEAGHYISATPFRRKIINISISALILGGILFFIKQFFIINLLNTIILSLFFLLIYIAVIFFTGCLDKNDLLIVSSFKEKIKALKKIVLIS